MSLAARLTHTTCREQGVAGLNPQMSPQPFTISAAVTGQ